MSARSRAPRPIARPAVVRRVGLRLDRAVARITSDTWDDLWPDIALLIDLPRSRPERDALRNRIRILRRSGVRPARTDPIPKADGLTRPGHYLWPEERVYYQALVDTVLHSIDTRLSSRGHIFGYRALKGPHSKTPFGRPLDQWKAFRQYVRAAARSGAYGAVVKTDVASYFERIQHDRLEKQLRALGVRSSVALEIRTLLSSLMESNMGLPQGSDPSSVLATAYLEPVDSYMLRKGYAFFRYVDDMYVFAQDEPEARVALRDLEAQLRRLQLNLQPGKTEILVGAQEIRRRVIDADNDVASIAWVYVRAPRKRGLNEIKRRWLSAMRRKPFPSRLARYLLRRLAANGDPCACAWCIRNLGVLDWMSREVGPYLAIFADKRAVQTGILKHLQSRMNNSAAEESSLLRVLLSASKVGRDLLDYARVVLADRNASTPSRQWACVLLGCHGDSADHALIVVHALESEDLARAAVIAAQGMEVSTKGLVLAQVAAAFAGLRPLIARLRGAASPIWPAYQP